MSPLPRKGRKDSSVRPLNPVASLRDAAEESTCAWALIRETSAAMAIAARVLLAASNLMGLPALLHAQDRGDAASAFVIGVNMVASALMHLSEARRPMKLHKSKLRAMVALCFWIIDLLAAGLALCHFAPRVGTQLDPLLVLVLGLVAWVVSEETRSLPMHLAAHLVFHTAAYAAMYMLVK
jgi:hypothetical protein